jgi:myo-inositol-1-phosphate synthase
MESHEDRQARKGKLTEAEINTLRSCIKVMEKFVEEQKVTYEGMKEVNNLYSMVRILNETYTERVINLLKEGYRF